MNEPRNQIRFFRLRKGVTQVDLAKAVGVTQQAIAKWESTNTGVSLKYVAKLSKALGVRKELLFPDLSSSAENQDNRPTHEEVLEYVIPYEVFFHFKGREQSYCAEVNYENADRIENLLESDGQDGLIWFDTIDNMVVVVNRNQLARLEIGQDLADLPEKRIERQKLGENNPDYEKDGDDRCVRLFLAGERHSYEEAPDPERDRPTLLRLLGDAMDGFLHCMGEFLHFETEADDVRRIYFRPGDFELIEGPKTLYDAHMDRVLDELKAEKS